jgi:hypothetical protein
MENSLAVGGPEEAPSHMECEDGGEMEERSRRKQEGRSKKLIIQGLAFQRVSLEFARAQRIISEIENTGWGGGGMPPWL